MWGAGPWALQVGLARVTRGMVARQLQCHFFGGPVAEAALLERGCPVGGTWVQRSLARAVGARAVGALPFVFSESRPFTQLPAAPLPSRSPPAGTCLALAARGPTGGCVRPVGGVESRLWRRCP